MVDVYYYINVKDIQETIECGLKLSEWYDKEVVIEHENRKCISTLLSPKDDMDKYNSKEFCCVRLEVNSSYCFAADKYLYQQGLNNPQIMNLYKESITSIDQYKYGTYRLPEVLVASTIIGGQITLINKAIDVPVLYDNSEELYINNLFEIQKEEDENFLDSALYFYYLKRSEIGEVEKFEDFNSDMTIFTDKSTRKVITIRTPKNILNKTKY